MGIFECTTHLLNKEDRLHIIKIREYTENFKDMIDSHIVSICEGDTDTSLELVKKRILNFLSTKSDKTKYGAVAEFIVHLYLNSIGFKQDCLFFNLEENSIKKGFDGVYSIGNEQWIMESKSGNISSTGISHISKIKEAYKDLYDKFSGKKTSEGNRPNNPWQNAYNHASHIDVNTNRNIRKFIKKLSDDFDNDVYYNIDDFNIIPSSTIFLNGTWYFDDSNLLNEVGMYLSELNYKAVNVICVTKVAIELFTNYLVEERGVK